MRKASRSFIVTNVVEGMKRWIISSKHDLNFELVAASFPMPGIDEGVAYRAMMFDLPEKKGVIMIYSSGDCCFIEVNPEDRLPLNLEQHILVPYEGRIYNVIEGRILEVVIDGEVFTTAVKCGKKRRADSMILAQYINGDIGPDEVRAAADAIVEEESARKKLISVQKELSATQVAHEASKKLIGEMSSDIKKARSVLKELISAFRDGEWGVTSRIRKVIKENDVLKEMM